MKYTKLHEPSAAAAAQHYKKMTETPIQRLILSLCAPTIVSMMITTVYNVADTFFVSQISVSASAATGILFSLMSILQAFGFMFGMGSGSCLSRRLGARDIDSASRYSSTGFALALAVGLLIMLLGLVWLKAFMRLLGSTETILPYASTYGFYILLAAPAFTTSCVMNNILRYEGLARLAMIGLISGGILNMVMDPILIFSLRMGIAGAGLSTTISQYLSMLLLFSMFHLGKTQSRLHPRYLSLSRKMLLDIVANGFPSMTRQGFNSASALVLNLQAAPFGDACIAAMSIVAKCSNLIFSVCIGIGQGFQPVCAFNYGAGRYSRVKAGMRFTWLLSTLVVTSFSLLSICFAPQLICLFRNEPQIVGIGTDALRYIALALILLPTLSIANMSFQSVGKSAQATLLACAQNGLFFIPLIMLLPPFLGVRGIELAKPIAYVFALLTALPFLHRFVRELPADAEA